MMDFINQLKVVYDLINPALDVFFLAILLYSVYGILVKTQAIQLFKGIVAMFIIYATAFIMKFETLLWILNALAPGLLISIAIIFQPELRKIFLQIGQSELFKIGKRSKRSYIDAVVASAEKLSSYRRGMLVVFIRKNTLKDIVESESGTRLDAKISSSLLVTIFGHDTPLHDGAVVIHGGCILAAACYLPLSEQQDIRKTFGTRHRAALGIAEQTDAVVVIVSEETGAMSLAYDSKLYYDLSSAEITRQLETLLDVGSESSDNEGKNE